MKHTIVLKFNKIPKNCGECFLYKNNIYEEDEPSFGDGVMHSCPFGAETFGCLVERPKDCPIGSTIEMDEKPKKLNSPYNIDTKIFENFVKEDTNHTRNELVDIVNYPQSYNDLVFIARCCHYKTGWAYYEAKKLGLDTPKRYYSRSHSNKYYDEGGCYGIGGDDLYVDCFDAGIFPFGNS